MGASPAVLTPQQNFTLGFIQKKTVVSTIVQITIERKKRKHHHPNPRQGVPHLAEAFVLCPAVLQPLPFRDGHGSYLAVSIAPLTRPALPTPILQASSRCSTSCSSRQPHKPQLLPFAASVAPWAFSPPQTKRPQLHRECPTLRGLTTTFRSDGQTTAP